MEIPRKTYSQIFYGYIGWAGVFSSVSQTDTPVCTCWGLNIRITNRLKCPAVEVLLNTEATWALY